MKFRLLAAFSLPLAFTIHAHEVDLLALEREAKTVTAPFANDLLQTLKQNLAAGGPPAALEACNLQAPSIANQASQKGWQVGRTALKTRNSDNRPDTWELETLLEFEQRKQAGEEIALLTKSAVVEGEYRFMKAIPTAEMCLACHGSALSPNLTSQLTKLYPEDQAIGFKAGDIRGAFTLKKALE